MIVRCVHSQRFIAFCSDEQPAEQHCIVVDSEVAEIYPAASMRIQCPSDWQRQGGS